MAYEFHVYESHFVSAAWFYCLDAGIGQLDEAAFEQAVQATGIPSKADAIFSLVQARMAALGFNIGEWAVLKFEDDVIDYEDFPLNHIEYYINIEVDAVEALDANAFPASTTTNYTQPAQSLIAFLQIDSFDPVTVVTMNRLDRIEANGEDDEA